MPGIRHSRRGQRKRNCKKKKKFRGGLRSPPSVRAVLDSKHSKKSKSRELGEKVVKAHGSG